MKPIYIPPFVPASSSRKTLAAGSPAGRFVLRGILAAAVLMTTFNSASAATDLTAAADLPLSVNALYNRLCLPEYWIGGKRIIDGSASQVVAGGDTLFLLVCGDGGSSTPFIALVMNSQGEAREAPISWTLNGKSLGDGGISNARFGSGAGTIVSRAHVSATCEPAYVHQWDGQTLKLVSRNTKGCKRGDL